MLYILNSIILHLLCCIHDMKKHEAAVVIILCTVELILQTELQSYCQIIQNISTQPLLYLTLPLHFFFPIIILRVHWQVQFSNIISTCLLCYVIVGKRGFVCLFVYINSTSLFITAYTCVCYIGTNKKQCFGQINPEMWTSTAAYSMWLHISRHCWYVLTKIENHKNNTAAAALSLTHEWVLIHIQKDRKSCCI